MISNVRIAKELVRIAKELTASRRRFAWDANGNGGINDDYVYMELNGGLDRGKLTDVMQTASDLFFRCGDALKESILEYIPSSLRGKVTQSWSESCLEFLPSYFAGRDCIGYPMNKLGVTKEEIEKAKAAEEQGVEYYDEDDKFSEAEKRERKLNAQLEALRAKLDESNARIEDLNKKIESQVSELERLNGEVNTGLEYKMKLEKLEGNANELEAMKDENDRLQEKYDSLERQYESLMNSYKSIGVTSPDYDDAF